MVDDGVLESIETLGDPPTGAGEVWYRLQDEKTEVLRSLLDEDFLTRDFGIPGSDLESSDEVFRELEWRHRTQLEARLRALNDAQDRLIERSYGWCTDCGEAINLKRLAADPAAALCLSCQTAVDGSLPHVF